MVGSPSRLLIVEDHDATRLGLTALLTRAGYDVQSAGTFAEGRKLLAAQAPDLLIADVRLGEYNGLQLIAAAPRSIASIVLTGFPDPALPVQLLRQLIHRSAARTFLLSFGVGRRLTRSHLGVHPWLTKSKRRTSPR